MVTNSDTTASGFEPGTFEGISFHFTEITELHRSATNILAKAKRHGRWWLLKSLRPEVANDPAYQEMLRKEYEFLMRAQHPGIVQAIGMEQVGDCKSPTTGTTDGMGMCIVMEYVEGVTLKEWIAGSAEVSSASNERAGQPRTQEAERILDELLDAVAYLHSLGIVHRDLKPSNILLTRGGLNVKLIDFGLADSDSYAVLKQQGGTSGYMSPEQATVATADVRNDIYSFGVIIRELPLKENYRSVWQRCLLPIADRYQNIGELQRAVEDVRRRSHRVRQALMAAAVMLAVIVAGTLLWMGGMAQSGPDQSLAIDSLRQELQHQKQMGQEQQQAFAQTQQTMEQNTTQALQQLHDSINLLTTANEQLSNELNREAKSREEALKALQERIKRSGIDRHTDTLTQWKYRLPDLSERVMAVNQFCYDYVEHRLPESLDEGQRERIRQAMLNEWQKWQKGVYALVKSTIPNPEGKVWPTPQNNVIGN